MKNKVRSLRPTRRSVGVAAKAAASTRRTSLIEAVEPRILFAEFVVSTLADAGPGSLRQAIIDANNAAGEDDIKFTIGSATDASVRTIALASPLPEITGTVTLDATTNPGFEVNNTPVIELNGAGAGAGANGLIISSSDSIASSNILGLIINRFSGNGIVIRGDGNLVADSYIGLRVDPANGSLIAAPNGGHGILIEGGDNNFIAENIIAHNGGDGIAVVDRTGNVATSNDLALNTFFNNGGMAIDIGPDGPSVNDLNDVDTGTNAGQNFPVLDVPAEAAGGGLTITGRINTTPNTLVAISVYSSPGTLSAADAEGHVIIDTVDVTTDGDGNATFTVPAPSTGRNDWITASATSIVSSGDTAAVNSSELSVPVRIETTVVRPQVAQVFVAGPALTGATADAGRIAFRTALGIEGQFGFPVGGGVNQVRALPWLDGINQIAVRFTEDVASSLGQADLAVRGSAVANYTISGFTYDAPTRTGVWTLSAPVTQDKLRLVIDDAGITGFDGEWTNPSGTPVTGGDAFPSGDGTSGGDFNYRINVLVGDATGDGIVSALDVADLKRRLAKRAGDGSSGTNGYSAFTDINGDGVISALDLAAVKQRLARRIDNLAEPASALLFSASPVTI